MKQKVKMNLFKKILNKINKSSKRKKALEQLPEILKDGMYTSMIESAHKSHKNNLKHAGLSQGEINSLICKKEEMSSIVNDVDEKKKFLENGGHQIITPMEELDLGDSISKRQESRAKSLKNKSKKRKK
jgi:predicted transcriptional regulator with HTH domain